MYNFDTGRGHEAAKARGSLKISTRVRKNSVVWLSVKVNFSFKSVSIFCLPSPKHTPMPRIHYLYMYTIDILKMRYFHKKKIRQIILFWLFGEIFWMFKCQSEQEASKIFTKNMINLIWQFFRRNNNRYLNFKESVA